MTKHALVANLLEFFEVIAFIGQFAIMKAITAIIRVFAMARVFMERHEAACTGVRGWH
jgi:hypothetical protein